MPHSVTAYIIIGLITNIAMLTTPPKDIVEKTMHRYSLTSITIGLVSIVLAWPLVWLMTIHQIAKRSS